MSSFKWKSLSNQPMVIPGISQDARPDAWVRDPCVIQVDDEYQMFHIGKQSSGLEEVMFNKSSIWMRTSSDGLNWRYQTDAFHTLNHREDPAYPYSAYRVNAPGSFPHKSSTMSGLRIMMATTGVFNTPVSTLT